GACQAGGSVIDWVMKAEAVSFRHAVELLRERHFPSLVAEPRRGRPASDGRVYPKKSVSKKLPEFAEPSAGDALLLGGRLLPRAARAEPGGARVLEESRARERGAHRAFQAWVFEPHARLPAAGEAGEVG